MNEQDALRMIDGAERVFLLEPNYRRKYPPLALMKIAARVRARGGKVKFARHYLGERCDLICVTSLFTYESATVIQAVRQALDLCDGTPVLIGGVYVSLMASHLQEHVGDKVFLFHGYSQELDLTVPDYSINWHVDEPWGEYSFTFTSRGCPNRCPYCAVHRIEPQRWVNPEWRRHIVPGKPYVMISDNNLSATEPSHFDAVLSHLANSGKEVAFDSGLDCNFITKDIACKLARINFRGRGMRLAFDRIDENDQFRLAVETLKRAGVKVSSMMTFVLFNFKDTPKEADYRMRVCCKDLGIRPYPQKFQKLNQTDRLNPYVGKHWTLRLAREFRQFWLVIGLGKKATFDEWIHARLISGDVSEEDVDKWDSSSFEQPDRMMSVKRVRKRKAIREENGGRR